MDKRKFRTLVSLLKKYKKCYLCGESICIGMDLNLDHVIPKSKGGKGGTNLRPVCTECNIKKADMVSKEYLIRAGYSEEEAESALEEHVNWREKIDKRSIITFTQENKFPWYYDHRNLPMIMVA